MKKQETTTATKTETTTTILETLQGLKSQDDSIGAIIKAAIAAVKTAEKKAEKEAAMTALATVIGVSTDDLTSLADDQLATLSAVPDGQKSAVFTAFKMAADLAAENQALKSPKKSAKKAEKKAEKITLKSGHDILSAFEFLIYKWEGHVPFSRIVAESVRRFKSNLGQIKSAEKADMYEASFRASYLSDEYIEKLADFIGRERFIDNRNIVEATIDEIVKQAKDELLKLVP